MKLLYILLALFTTAIGGYFVVNNFNFDSGAFSSFLIDSLFVLMIFGVAAVGIVAAIASKRKQYYKDVMTIRQYYDYKSAR